MIFNRCLHCMQAEAQSPCPNCGFEPEKYKPESYELPPQSILASRYLVGTRLGQGGFGITYVGFDLALNVKVAIKEFYPTGQVTRHPSTGQTLLWNDGEQAHNMRTAGIDSFLKEARKMAKIKNIQPIVRVLNTFQENETAYIVMEFVEGITESAWMEQNGPVTWDRAKELFFPVIETMEEMHKANIIHRDISPDNLMIQPDGAVRILDLGAAKDLSANSGKSSMLVMKEGYSPIEQYTQSGASGSATDVYALAATMYFMLTGTVPPSAAERIDDDCIDWSLPQLKALPKNVLAAMQHAMVVLAAGRTQTMAQFLEELQNPKFSFRPQAAPVPGGQQKKKKGRGGLIAAIVLLVLAAAGGAGYYFLAPKEAPPAAVPAAQLEAPAETAPAETAPAETAPETQPPQTEPADEEPPEVPNVSGYVNLHNKFANLISSGVSKDSITKIRFLDHFEPVKTQVWDVSSEQNNTVHAWMEDSELCIGTTGKLVLPKDCSELFSGYSALTEVTFHDDFHAEGQSSLHNLFADCPRLETVDLSGFNTKTVTDMSGMFRGCFNLKAVDLSVLNTENVTNMDEMFLGCDNADELDIWAMDVRGDSSHQNFMSADAKPLGRPWANLFNRNALMISDSKDTTHILGSEYLRSDIRFLYFQDTLDGMPANAWDVSYGGDGSTMAWVLDHGGYRYLYIASEGGVMAPEDCSEFFANYTNLRDIKFNDAFDTSAAGNMRGMFRECNTLTALDLNFFNTSGVRDMSEMFYYCSSLNTLQINEFDTSNVTNMSGMFSNCNSRNMGILDVSGFNTAKVTDMSSMFYNCLGVYQLDVSGFDTGNVTTMEKMFMNCANCATLNVSNFNTENVTNMSCMFFGCSLLYPLDVSSFNTAKVTNMSSMFANCTKINTLNVSGFDTANVTDMSGMFRNCTALASLDVSGFNTSKVTDMSRMFRGCKNLFHVNAENFDVSQNPYHDEFMEDGYSVGGKGWTNLFNS